MGDSFLRSAAFGGYDKTDVLVTVDTLNAAKLAYKEGSLPLAELKRTADEVAAHEFKKTFTGGFNKEDVENYISSLCNEIQHIRE